MTPVPVVPLGGPLIRSSTPRNRLVGGWLLALATMVALAASNGCSLKNPHDVGTLERARFWEEHEHYQEAADAYEIFIRQNPTDSLAAQAQYEKALAYMEIQEYPLAAVELQILAQDYPISPLVEDAMYREGECYYFQVGRLERDVTPAYEARLHWLDFSREFPTSPYMTEVRGYMQDIADMLVRKDLRAVEIYTRLGRHDAAALALDRILEDEPTASILDEVLLARAKVARKLGDSDLAAATYQRILDDYPDSPLRLDASRALDKLRSKALDDDESS